MVEQFSNSRDLVVMKVHYYKIPISVSNLDVKKVLVYDGFAYRKNKETEA